MDFKELDKYIVAMKFAKTVIEGGLNLIGEDSADRYNSRCRNFAEAYNELEKVEIESILSEALSNTDGEPKRTKKLLELWRIKLYPNQYDGLIFDIDVRWGDLDTTYRKKMESQGVLNHSEADLYLMSLERLICMAEAKSHALLDIINRLKITFEKSAKKIATFADLIQHQDKEKILSRLHELIDGRGGSDVGSILAKAIWDGYLKREPTQEEYKSEFNLIGSWEGIRKYFAGFKDDDKKLQRALDIIIF